MKTTTLKAVAASLGFLTVAAIPKGAMAAESAEEIIGRSCVGCHSSEGEQQWSRISKQRKTPEGWLMTIARMQLMHGLQIEEDDRRTLVKYFSDNQGLAPSETEGARYALERRLNTQESFESQQFTETCARCHSGARVKLQRRTAEEWEHLVHFHLGQWPTTEYQAMGRDREWLNLALNEMVPELAESLPLESDAWEDWQQRPETEVAGNWTMAGHLPGRGSFHARMVVAEAGGEDQYTIRLDGEYADGTPIQGEGQAIVYTGYEWRANLEVDGENLRQVFALTDGQLKGRMFYRNHDEVGADVVAAREGGDTSRILALQPAYIKAGTEAEIAIVGADLEGTPELGEGLELVEVLEHSDSLIRVRVKAASDQSGSKELRVGLAASEGLVVYDQIAQVKVVPEFAVARVGGNGGSTPKVEARFEAEAWAAGPDGEIGTEDDYRVGLVPATWSVEPFNEVAEADEDVRFAGRMNPATGVFTPGAAGPNSERRMMTNNAGNLTVKAQVKDGDTTLDAEGHMIVTVQRWNNPPIP